MGKSSRSTRVSAPDPAQLMRLQEQYNRVNTSSPFGSQTYSQGPDGRTSFTTSLSPQMQGLVDRGMGLAGRDLERYKPPEGFESIIAALMSRVGNRVGGAK